MTNNDMESKLRKAVGDSTPDVLDAVLAQCDNTTGKVMNMKRQNNHSVWKAVIGVAAALVLVAVGAFGYALLQDDRKPPAVETYSTVTIDVNPSLSIAVDKQERVVAVIPLNKDAEPLLEGLDFVGVDLDVAVNAVIGSMVRHGYVNELANSILISVDSRADDGGDALRRNLVEKVQKLLITDTFYGAVLSQTVLPADNIAALAARHEISAGKAQLIQKLIAADSRYTFEQLAPLSINELNLLIGDREAMVADQSTVVASQGQYVGRDKAKQVALAHAGIGEAEAKAYNCEMDYENGKMLYEIEFIAGGYEYDYDIDAVSGDVAKAEKEPADRDDALEDAPPVNSETYIGKEAAKAAALKHAGLDASAVRELEAELDEENGVWEYQVEFRSGGYEYDYAIDPVSGAVKRHEKEKDD